MSPNYDSGGWIKDPQRDLSDRRGNLYSRFVTWIRKRCPWLPWVSGGVVLFVGLTVLFLWITGSLKSAEEQYADRCRKYLLGVEGQEGEITSTERRSLDKLAKDLKLSDEKRDEICLQVKQGIYREREKEYRGKPGSKGKLSPEDGKILAALAERMGIEGSPMKPMESQTATSKPGTVEEVRKLLGLGQYGEALELASKFPHDPEVSSLAEGIDSLLDVKVSFQFQRPGEPPSEIFPMGAEGLKGLSLTHKDNYRLFFETRDKCHLYIFQIDDLGKVERLFPDPQALNVENPLQPHLRYVIPSGKKEWLYLEEITAPTEAINETFYFLAARWEGKDLEEAYAGVRRAQEKREWEKALSHLMERIKSRGEVKKSGVLFKEFVVRHAR